MSGRVDEPRVEYGPEHVPAVSRLPVHIGRAVQSRGTLWSLVQRELRSRYKQSVFGMLWILLYPLAQLALYTVVFSHVLRVDTGEIPYPLFVYSVLLPWHFFSQSILTATTSLVDNSAMVSRIYFPREVLPLSCFLVRLVDLTLGFAVLLPLLFISGFRAGPWTLAAVPLFLGILAFGLGLGFFFSALQVYWRDFRNLTTLAVSMGVYFVPVLYPLSMIPERWRPIYFLNPLSLLMHNYRICFLQQKGPEYPWETLAALGVSCLVMIGGYLFFKDREHEFSEKL